MRKKQKEFKTCPKCGKKTLELVITRHICNNEECGYNKCLFDDIDVH